MHLISRGVLALSLLGNVEAEVLQQDDGSGGGVSAGGFHLRTHTVLQEGDIPAESQRTGEDARSDFLQSRQNKVSEKRH